MKQCHIDRRTLLALMFAANVWLQVQIKCKTKRLYTTKSYKYKFIIHYTQVLLLRQNDIWVKQDVWLAKDTDDDTCNKQIHTNSQQRSQWLSTTLYYMLYLRAISMLPQRQYFISIIGGQR